MSKETAYLDLDRVVPPAKSVRIFGAEYPMHQQSLRDFATATREQSLFNKRLEAGEVDEAEQVEYMLKSLRRILPDITEEHLDRLTMDQLIAITAFAQASAEEGAPKAGDEGKGEKAES